MLLGQEFGGLEADPITATQVVEIISESNASAGWIVMILASTSYWASAMLPDDAAQEVFLSGPEISMAGTLVPQGKAVKSEEGWLLSGRWPFGSGCLHADWMASGGVLSEAGEPVVDDSGAPIVRLFLTPVSDCRILDTWDTTRLRATGSGRSYRL